LLVPVASLADPRKGSILLVKTANIKGYRDLTQDDVDRMNAVKDLEIQVGDFWRTLTGSLSCDKRWAAIAKTHFEEGFSALVRSIAQPENRF
jgi:hypothetical protein